MANNKLTDLNNHLFAQLERLSDEAITDTDLEKEMLRSKAINSIAKSIIDNARTTLEGMKFITTDHPRKDPVPDQFRLNQ